MTLQVGGFPELTDSYGTITTTSGVNSGGEFRDGGTAGWDGLASSPGDTGIDYDFAISPVVVVAPATPQSKDDCTKGGWEALAFGFRNQGQCIKSVVTGK